MNGLLLALVLSLNGSWNFHFAEGQSAPSVASPDFVATDTMVVPGCYDALPKWFMKRGTGLYRRTFALEQDVPAAWLVIDGLGLYGRFWIDGREIVYENPDIAGLAFWQLYDTRSNYRDCGIDGKKRREAMSYAGLFTADRRPKQCVRTLATWFKEKTPANMK